MFLNRFDVVAQLSGNPPNHNWLQRSLADQRTSGFLFVSDKVDTHALSSLLAAHPAAFIETQSDGHF